MREQIKKPQGNPYKSYAIYSVMAFQMAVIIALGTFAGSQLDTYFSTESPVFTAGFSLLAVLVAIFFAIRQILKASNN